MRILSKNKFYIIYPTNRIEGQTGWEIGGVYYSFDEIDRMNDEARAYSRTVKRLEASRLRKQIRELS